MTNDFIIKYINITINMTISVIRIRQVIYAKLWFIPVVMYVSESWTMVFWILSFKPAFSLSHGITGILKDLLFAFEVLISNKHIILYIFLSSRHHLPVPSFPAAHKGDPNQSCLLPIICPWMSYLHFVVSWCLH